MKRIVRETSIESRPVEYDLGGRGSLWERPDPWAALGLIAIAAVGVRLAIVAQRDPPPTLATVHARIVAVQAREDTLRAQADSLLVLARQCAAVRR